MNQNTAEDGKKRGKYKGFAIASLVIGILIILFILYAWFAVIYAMVAGSYIEESMESSSIFSIVVDSFGLLSGIIGLKSNSRRIAKAGIILCSLSFILLIMMIVKGPGLLGLTPLSG